MSFNGYDVNNPQKAYEGLKHCYCPPWDDKAMPYSKESYITWDGSIVYHWKSAGVNNKGWVNGCAMQQKMFLQSLYSQSAQGESSGTAAQSAGQKRGTTSLEKKLSRGNNKNLTKEKVARNMGKCNNLHNLTHCNLITTFSKLFFRLRR